MKRTTTGCTSILLCLLVASPLVAADWPRFRGPDGLGISADTNVPVKWSESRNLKWKTALPGPGSSSPIVWGQHIYVTCYSDYGLSRTNPGNIEELRRHLLCIDRTSGKVVWSRTVKAAMPEDPFAGLGLPEHGYASNTPVTDGERVYAFFGKTGVFAFDLDGNQLWQVNVGKESSNRRWGSSASLTLYKDMVIVNASEESQSIRALQKSTGEQLWKAEAGLLELAFGTPTLVELGDDAELVIGVPEEIWSLDPVNGQLKWYAETNLTGNVSPSVVAGDGIVYLFGGYRSSGSHALRVGGKGDVTDSHMLWSSRNSSYVATPLLHNGHLYWVDDRGQAFCVSAKTGESVYRERLTGVRSGGRPFYASPVLAGGKIYVVSRFSGTFVFTARPEFEQVAQNQLSSDDTYFNATPAISNSELFLRSNKYLYCVADEGKQP
jgi:outer membrane protein assembly factor BamB